MNKNILLMLLVISTSIVFAQQQLPNSGFENWENEGSATMEPINWSSLKTADALASMAPEVLSRDAGRTGNWSIVLEVKSAFTISANGIITTGRVHADFNPENGYVYTDVSNPQWHSSFNDRPDSITGWFKYAPKSGDKGKIEIILHKGNEGRLPANQTTIDNMVGRAFYGFTSEQTDWTRFSAPFNYKNEDDLPDYVLVTIAAGDSTVSKAGTKIWIDDLELIYNQDEEPTAGLIQFEANKVNAYGNNGSLFFEVKDIEQTTYQVLDLSGKIIQSGNAMEKVDFKHNNGIYIIKLQTPTDVYVKKLYITQ